MQNPMKVDPAFWKGRSVFLTGHTGFKGGWLSLWLQSMGVELHGYALAPPTDPALFQVARVADGMASTFADVRDASALQASMKAVQPEIVIHMAAQPLVRLSYAEPVATYATNVMGTVHLLEAVRHTTSVRAVVNVTTDKCYENRDWVWGYREDEPMGGHDPYSNSKGCSELVTSAYRRSYFQAGGPVLASARAGNVIGGGDWAPGRLVPDILSAFEHDAVAFIRNPHATRPWQHVLEPLSGYLVLAQCLVRQGRSQAGAFNFGPHEDDARAVQWIVENLAQRWGRNSRWQIDGGEHPHEANHLKLDISKAKARLGWHPRWQLTQALDQVVNWHRAWLDAADMRAQCLQQIEAYTASPASVPEASTR